MIKAILFDLDDTLLNSKEAEYNAICEFKSSFNVFNKISNDEFAKIWNQITAGAYDEYEKGKFTFKQQRIERIKRIFKKYNVDVSDKEAHERFNMYLKLYEQHWKLIKNAKEVLEKLSKDFKLAIVTNGDSKHQRKKIETLGIQKYFSQIIISSEVGYAKPSQEIFKLACEKLNLLPEECIMVGDRLKKDIVGSKAIGMKALWLNSRNEQFEYEYEIKNLNEILNYI